MCWYHRGDHFLLDKYALVRRDSGFGGGSICELLEYGETSDRVIKQ